MTEASESIVKLKINLKHLIFKLADCLMPHFSKPYASVDPSVVPEASLG